MKQRFGAASLHRDLTGRGSDDLALGLIRAEPVVTAGESGGWPKVRSGVLTRDAVLGAVAERHLGLPDTTPDAPAVLEWSTDTQTVTLVRDLHHLAEDPLTDSTLTWLAARPEKQHPSPVFSWPRAASATSSHSGSPRTTWPWTAQSRRTPNWRGRDWSTVTDRGR